MHDPSFEPAGQFCPACTCNNLLSATQCEVCGAPLRGRPGSAAPEPGDPPPDDPGDAGEAGAAASLDSVAFDQRESLGRFSSDFEADLAAGLLRSQGIAVEITPPMPYGVRTPELWTYRRDAAAARRLLVHASAGEQGPLS